MANFNVRFVAKNGLDNNNNTITNLGAAGSNLGFSGGHAVTLTTTGTTGLTMPTTGTLATLTDTVLRATNIAGGTANQIPYQTGAGTTSFYSAANYGVQIYGATGIPQSIAGAAGVLQGSASAVPVFTTTPTLTGTNFSGIPNSGLTNSSITIGSTNIALGATSTTLAGLSSVTSTSFTGALTGNSSTATTLATGRTFSVSGDATGTSAAFDGSANASIPVTLATVNSNTGTFASVTVNGKGLVTAAGNLTGDITSSGAATTLATVNASPQTDQFRRITINGKGLVTATSAVSSSDITTSLGYTPVNRAGDTMTGALNFGGFTATNAGTPTAGTDLTTKNYVDAAITGLSWKTSVKAATTANITLSGTQTIDGIALVATDRVLVKNQTSTPTNGIYVVAAGAWARSTDADTAAELDGSAVYVMQGTTQADTGWVETATVVTLGTDPVVFAQFSGSGTYTAGTGLSLTGNTFANTGVTSAIAGTNISVSSATGAVTIAVTGTVASATNATNTAITDDTTTNATKYITWVDATSGNQPQKVSSTNLNWNPSTGFLGGMTTVSTSSFFNLTRAAGNSRTLRYQTSGSNRWDLTANVTAETGSNAGTNFVIDRYDDSGTRIDSPIVIVRSTGVVSFASAATFSNGLNSTTTIVVGTTGRINLVPDATNSGYIEFRSTAGIRQGYIGNSSTNLSQDTGTIPYVAGNHQFTGNIGVGGTLVGSNVSVVGAITGNSGVSSAFRGSGTVQSDVTTTHSTFLSSPSTQASSFNISNFRHFGTNQPTFGAGSTVTTQTGFLAESNLIGANINLGFLGAIPQTLFTITNVARTSNVVTITTSAAHGYLTNMSVTVAATTNTGVNGQFTITSVPTTTTFTYSQTGADITSVADTGTVTSANRWNVYISGTAPNYMAGSLGVGTLGVTGYLIRASGNITNTSLSGTAYGIASNGTIQSDVTGNAGMIYAQPSTAAGSYTISNLYSFVSAQGTFGAGSTVTNQYGYFAQNSLTGAVNNYGYFGNISNSSFTITNVARTSNVATITTSAAHGFFINMRVLVAANTNTSLNGTVTIVSVPTTTTFTYSSTGTDITSVADTGSVTTANRSNVYVSGTAPSNFLSPVAIGYTSQTVPGRNLDVFSISAGVARFVSTQASLPSTLDNGEIFNINLASPLSGSTFSSLDPRLITYGLHPSGRSYVRSLSLDTVTTNEQLFSPGNTERLRIAANGAFGLSGTNYGTSGQVMASTGSGSAPVWTSTPTGITSVGTLTSLITSGTGTFDVGGGSNSATPALVAQNASTARIIFVPRNTAGGYVGLTQAGDQTISATGSAIESGALVLGAWTANNTGVRITPTTTTITGSGGIVFGTSGTEAARFDSSGNLLISGTSSPVTAKLNVIGTNNNGNSAAFTNTTTTQFSGTNIFLGNGATTNNFGATIGTAIRDTGAANSYFYMSAASSTGAFDRTLCQYDFTSNFWSFFTSGTERMRLDSSGNLGIGTTSPRNAGAGYAGITLNGTNSGFLDINTNGTRIFTAYGISNDSYLVNPTASGSMLFLTNNTEKLRITSDGRLYGTALHNNSGSVTGSTNQYIASGTYTPTVTAGTNVSSAAGGGARWTRVGNVVSVGGVFSATFTTASTTSTLNITLPIPTQVSIFSDLTGTANSPFATHGQIFGQGTPSYATFYCRPASGDTGSSITFAFTLMYTVQ